MMRISEPGSKAGGTITGGLVQTVLHNREMAKLHRWRNVQFPRRMMGSEPLGLSILCERGNVWLE